MSLSNWSTCTVETHTANKWHIVLHSSGDFFLSSNKKGHKLVWNIHSSKPLKPDKLPLLDNHGNQEHRYSLSYQTR